MIFSASQRNTSTWNISRSLRSVTPQRLARCWRNTGLSRSMTPMASRCLPQAAAAIKCGRSFGESFGVLRDSVVGMLLHHGDAENISELHQSNKNHQLDNKLLSR